MILSSRRWRWRWPLWPFIAALLLKAAVPMLASAAAQMQGVPLVEICGVYGVRTLPAGDPAPGDSGAALHLDDHCALAGMLALAAPPPAGSVLEAARPAPAAAAAQAQRPAPADAVARWAALRKHGPPVST